MSGDWRVYEDAVMAQVRSECCSKFTSSSSLDSICNHSIKTGMLPKLPKHFSAYIVTISCLIHFRPILHQFVPPEWEHIGEEIIEAYKHCQGMDKWEAMTEYIELAMTLDTYGEHLFLVSTGDADFFLAINYLHLAIVNFDKINEHCWNLNEIRATVRRTGFSDFYLTLKARNDTLMLISSEYEVEFSTPAAAEICELIEDLQELEFSDKKVRFRLILKRVATDSGLVLDNVERKLGSD